MLRSVRTVTLLGVAVQFAAFARTAIIAASLGASLDVDAYNIGLIAPTFVSTVIGSWVQVSFVGRYTSLVTLGDERLAAAYRTRMLAIVLTLAAIFASLCFLLPQTILALFMPGIAPGLLATSVDALQVAGWTMLPIILADFIGLILNCHGRFLAAAMAPLFNALVSVAALLLWPTSGLSSLVWTLLLGSVAQLLVVSAALLQLKLRYPIDTRAAKGEVRRTLVLALPLLPAVMLSNAMAPMIQFRAAELGEGAVAVFGYAMRLHWALMQVLVMGLGTVLLPHFAALVSRNEKDEIVSLLRRLARVGMLVTLCLSAVIILMGNAIVDTLLGRGAFDSALGIQVAQIWAVLSLSLFPFAFGTFIAKLGQAMRQVSIILATSVASFLATLIMTKVGGFAHDLVVICIAPTAAVTAATCIWLIWLNRKFYARPVLADIAAAALRSIVVLVIPVFLDIGLRPLLGDLPGMIALGLRGIAFVAVVGALLWGLGWQRWFLAAQFARSERLPATASAAE
ncbi:lipid II flippase MurJ [Mesorhizobium sp. BAC0120]|uniref:murein biosynthesis integral membrane protein MurJ n=1 Tax=Mesorhizobium sp. BAC0120 TaxID=3090670 RepID=UPI00298C5A3E|nr:lipid II flippase MurJ [Mesorhizobium sp. BAC0120]MDW6020967.1 lipid II flippase MurJ [Mesorhizobium sp. BAC0120]